MACNVDLVNLGQTKLLNIKTKEVVFLLLFDNITLIFYSFTCCLILNLTCKNWFSSRYNHHIELSDRHFTKQQTK